jgi:hypothetical protein
MADRSNDYDASDDDDGASQDDMPFEEVFRKIHPFLALMRI